MFNTLSHIQKRLTLYLPLTMLLAVIYGYYFNPQPLRALITPIIFFMVYPMMVTLKYKELFTKGNKRLHIVTQLVNFVIFPFLGFFIWRFSFSDNQYIGIGLLLMALLPTSGMTISWTGFAKGNVSAAIKMMVVGLIMGSILTPVYLRFFMGTATDIPFSGIVNEIIKVVFIPMIIGFITQKVLVKKYGQDRFQKDFKTRIPLIATLALIGIVFISTAMRAKTIVSNPQMLLKILIVLSIAYFFSFLLVTIIAKVLFNREDGIALVYGTVMRNLSIALAIALSIFSTAGSDVALIVAVAFVVQIQGAALYLKVVDRLLGSQKTPEIVN